MPLIFRTLNTAYKAHLIKDMLNPVINAKYLIVILSIINHMFKLAYYFTDTF